MCMKLYVKNEASAYTNGALKLTSYVKHRSTKEAVFKKTTPIRCQLLSAPFQKTSVKRGTSPKGKEVGTNTQMKNRSELTHIQYPELYQISIFNAFIFPKNHIIPLKYMQDLTRMCVYRHFRNLEKVYIFTINTFSTFYHTN